MAGLDYWFKISQNSPFSVQGWIFTATFKSKVLGQLRPVHHVIISFTSCTINP